jgi:hypothetical protein
LYITGELGFQRWFLRHLMVGPTVGVLGVRRFIAAFFPVWQHRGEVQAARPKAAMNRRTPKGRAAIKR